MAAIPDTPLERLIWAAEAMPNALPEWDRFKFEARLAQQELIEALQGVLKDHEYPLYCIAFDKADRIRALLAKHREPARG